MGRIISFIIVVIVMIAKYFIYKHFDTKKINEEVEKSKTVWVESFKTEYLANCIKNAQEAQEAANLDLYCNCVADRIQQAGAFPTAYNADEVTAEQYEAELDRLSNAYFDSELGKRNTEECADLSMVK